MKISETKFAVLVVHTGLLLYIRKKGLSSVVTLLPCVRNTGKGGGVTPPPPPPFTR